jgi:leucyl-tRNA synthetase
MMAPITPEFSEECWKTLQYAAPPEESGGVLDKLASFFSGKAAHAVQTTSVFDVPFPEEDGTYDWCAPDTQPCAVQVNGKFRFAAEIPIPPSGVEGKALQKWITDEILQTEEGKARFVGEGEAAKKGKVDIRKAKKVIVVRGGKTVNFIV